MTTNEKNPQTYYESTPEKRSRVHRLISLRIRNIALNLSYFNKDRADGAGVFDIVDPEAEADMLMRDLVLFGYMDKDLLFPGETP